MWKASVGKQIEIKTPKNDDNDDDWETDPDFINDVTEQEQRWGSKTVEGSGRDMGAIDMKQLRHETELADAALKKKQREEDPNKPAFGYGGKFGIQADRMDQSAVGHDYVAKLEKHVSQKDYSTGFGGKFGVQTDRVDKSAENWDYKEKIDKHASQKDYTTGFGGKFGVQADRQDKSAVGWDHVEKVDKHESQKDYSVGFGGKFGVQADRQDKSAVGWDHHEKLHHHESQTDHKVGFGGKFGVQTDRMDKSAVAFTDAGNVGTAYSKTKPDIGGAKPSDLRARFENMIQSDPKEPEKKIATGGKLDMSKTAMFTKKAEEPLPKISPVRSTPLVNKFVEKEPEVIIERKIQPGRNTALVNKFEENQAEFTKEKLVEPVRSKVVVDKVEEKGSEAIIEKSVEPVEIAEKEEGPLESTEEVAELEDTGLVAVALYDYQSAADDEISFDPEDVITHVEMIDEGWWRGLCHGKYGLFPANYVQLVTKNS